VATVQKLTPTPPPIRGLKTLRGARHELTKLYRETKVGAVEPAVAGKLAHIIGLLIASLRDHDFERRLDALEAALAEQRGQPARPNGSGYREAKP
jgi:hypothetical protein